MKSSSPFWDKGWAGFGLLTILAVHRDKPGFDVGGIGLSLSIFLEWKGLLENKKWSEIYSVTNQKYDFRYYKNVWSVVRSFSWYWWMYTQQSDSERRLHRARFDQYFLTFFSPKSKQLWWTGKETHVCCLVKTFGISRGTIKGTCSIL